MTEALLISQEELNRPFWWEHWKLRMIRKTQPGSGGLREENCPMRYSKKPTYILLMF